ncbi:MAG: hypothetical protein ONB06_09540, partial [candidate division KSB1 bacterium]|nr:hypothetical protein [candidate division KSB1 bacterium]
MLLSALAVAASFALHAPFVVRGFGESDSAVLANTAAVWHATGKLGGRGSYVQRTSPLYLVALKTALDLGMPLRRLPGLMNWANAVMGSVALLPMFFVLRKLVSWEISVGACAIWAFSPAFWLANIYGMPHLPALLLFLASLASVSVWCDARRIGAIISVLIALVTMTAACTLKADIVLCSLALPGVLWARRRLSAQRLLVCALISGVSVGITLALGRCIGPEAEGTVEYAGTECRAWLYCPLCVRLSKFGWRTFC